jgi:hypothetical protein
MGVDGQRHAVATPPQKTRYPLCRRLGGPPRPVWMGVENLASTGIPSPYRPARTESLYQLSYPNGLLVADGLEIFLKGKYLCIMPLKRNLIF